MWEGGLGSGMNPATSQGGAGPLPPPGCHLDSVPSSQPAGNLPLHRKVCIIQEAPDSSSPLGFSSREEAEHWQAESSLSRKVVNVAGGALSPPPSPPSALHGELF